jgi:hypothetical protein
MSTELLHVFDRICIINLPERIDRRRAVTRELSRLGVAVDGQRVRFVAGIRPDALAGFPSLGARGCYLSHLQLLREAAADGVRRLLVLEDDVMFHALARQAAALAPALRDDGWQLAYPGHILPAQDGALRWLRCHDEALQCAHCYAVHGDALPVLVDFLEACLRRPAGDPVGGPMHFDGALNMLRHQRPELVTLRASRSLAGQRSSRSDIIGPSWLDRAIGHGPAACVRVLRNGWRRLSRAD